VSVGNFGYNGWGRCLQICKFLKSFSNLNFRIIYKFACTDPIYPISDINIIALIDGDVRQHQHQVVRLNVDLSLLYDVDASIMLEEIYNFNANAI
jgi:hypothetical protein